MQGLSARTLLLVLACSVLSSMLTFLAVTPTTTRILSPVAKIHERFQDLHGHSHEEEREIPDNVLAQHDPSELHHKGEAIEAERIAQEVKVLCWILTSPSTHDKKAKHVKATWGKRCNKLIFMSSSNDSVLGAIDIGAGDGRDVLWGKTKKAYKYVYDHHLNEYDWFFKGDDDTYVLMENMRYMLAAYDPTFPIYFGSRFKKFSKQGYMSGGGGYVLSRAAVKKFIEDALPNKLKCKEDDTGAEDAEMGKCLDNIGVLAGDSRDSLGRGRFFPFTPATHLMGGVPDWYLDYVYYKPDTGLDCCSDTPVTFHYVSTDLMYTLEYLLYHARPYGIVHHDPYPAPLPPDTKSIPEPILEKQRQKLEALKSKEQQQNDILTQKVGENVISV
ncbi:glycoprotein-N-acetylgalactosamine 3-beta-galactosyltransferase 1-like [Macrobrachium nipponense]|uniref:glycoprotein-N-acetylgalactosamine 3-beta-galactosyltransferase 1-like n=1 Tax=Macrobrachium nipponense TaxID=159736 RepID=UPI0030C7EFC9